MLFELKNNEYYKVLPVFKNIEHNKAVVFSVIEGDNFGRVFVDNAEEPDCALVNTLDCFYYLGGDESNRSFIKEVVKLIFDELLPQKKEKEMILFSFGDSLRVKLDEELRGKNAVTIYRKTFKFNHEKFRIGGNQFSQAKDGFSLATTQGNSSKGFGFAVVQGERIISECSSVAVGGGEAEIDIATDENYRGMGFGKMVSTAFIEHCLANNLIPNWACWPYRTESIALAEKLGFVFKEDVPAHFWAENM